MQKCEPNPAHFALGEWEKYFEDFTLVTQNVNGLHTRTGSQNLIELHGNINRSRCLNCEKRFQMKAKYVSHKPEMCDKCSSKVRPAAILPEAAKQNGYI